MEEDKVGKLAIKAGAKLLDKVGGGFGGSMARAIFIEDKGRDVVVPPDLDMIRVAKVDGDGNVDCIYCRGKVAFAAASMIGSEGFACGRCLSAFPPAAVELPEDVRIKRGPVPYLIAFGVVAVIGAIIAVNVL